MKNTKNRIWFLKLGMALILSNIFFFILFGQKNEEKIPIPNDPQLVQVQIEAQLLTPFESGKKILIIHRGLKRKIEGQLYGDGIDELGRVTISVKENDATKIFNHHHWEILPFLKNHHFASIPREGKHEIRY